MRRSAVTLAALASLAAAFPVASAQASPRAILAAVNLEREMAGLKPLAWNNEFASSCNAHTRYMEANGTLTHAENEGSPLYSTEGFWAGSRAVLARSSAGFSGNPWHNAPFHQFQVLHPWLAQTGVSITGGYACMVTMGDRDAPNPSEISLSTVPGVAQYTAPAEIARESPFTPGDEVGLPQGTKTGPHIYVYAQGPNRFNTVGIQNASLTAVDGSTVELRWVDGTSARSGKFLDGGAILIPVVPLKENMQYGLRVEAATTAQNGTRLLISRTSSFVTGPDESDLVQSPEASDTVTAASRRDPAPTRTTSSSSGSVKRAKKGAPVTIGEAGTAQLQVSLRWTGTGVRAKIHCASDVSRCQGPLRILVRRKGGKVQKLRFKARGGPLKLSLAPGRTINRRVVMTKRQKTSGKKRGFAVRWGAPAPEKARALEIG